MSETNQGQQVETVLETRKGEIEAFVASTDIAVIETQPQYDTAVEVGKKVHQRIKDLEQERVDWVKPLNDTVTKINDGYKKIKEPLEKFKAGIKTVCLDFQAEQKRIRDEAQAKLDEEARKAREKVEEAARVQREKEDAARRAEEEARQKAAQEQDAAKRAQLLKEAEAEKRKAEAAAVKAETKEAVSATIVAPTVASTVENRGISGTKKWRATVTDKKAFLEWAIANNSYEFIAIDDKMLTRDSNSSKGARSWPGVKVEEYIQARMGGK